jgi:hypothetical protein
LRIAYRLKTAFGAIWRHVGEEIISTFCIKAKNITYIPITQGYNEFYYRTYFYLFEDSHFSGISEVNKNEYCVVSTPNWH